MNKIEIKIAITSLDSDISFETVGEYKNSRLKFVDPDGALNYIILHKDVVEYYKTGEMDMKYKFDLDKVTKGYYELMGNKFSFDIVTNEIRIDDDYIFIKYDLYQNSELVNQTRIEVFYQVKEEL
jgi:uncharacterized beta-barrel protein YwiB (DUF1934 family)